ncbi:hypothetical protein L1987_04432 [Smallanthus sonchifolius]|uniref:Uncharacterized protein n=1 Tax=Smallanthus sonchifolius TaxID=185202 RepID=A0ACB9KDE2_9ASTR|nr:hypothetical protein L1987_04432 [Smallanthus sonchifolius]
MGSHGKSDGLSKQGPLCNLTLDEVQHQLGDLGKPLTNMNLDELMKSVCESEATNQLASASSMAADLSKKTVDEDIQNNKDISGSDGHKKSTPTLGEMTLEDFLAKARVVAKSSHDKKNSPLDIALPHPQPAQWMQYQIPPIQQQQQHHVLMPAHQQPINEVAYPETQITISSDTQAVGRKRVASEDLMEKCVERRQKRMIKNRESAARSRARKQAYTHELENKVSRLEEENEILKREHEAEKALPFAPPPPEPKYQLRRTSSALF